MSITDIGQDTGITQQPEQTVADVNDDSQQYSNMDYALDSHAALAGEPQSIWQTGTNFITKALPLTGLDIVNSFANTGIEFGNWISGDNLDKWSIQAEAPEAEKQLGTTGLSQYYSDHQSAIDLSSLVAGSLIPGSLGVKGYKYGTAALDAYATAAEAGNVSNILSRATGLLPSIRQAKIVASAEQQIVNPDSLFNSFTKEKLGAIANGFGDQALQSLFYEVATTATMKANPITDEQSLGDIAENTFMGMLTGAGIGGTIEGIGMRAKFASIKRTADMGSKAQQIFDDLGIGGYEAGDKVNTILNSLYEMPEASTVLGRSFSGRTQEAGINVAKKALTDLAGGDNEVSNSFLNNLLDMKNSGGMDKDQVYEKLARLNSISRIINTTVPDIDDGSFYVAKRIKQQGQSDIPQGRLMGLKPEDVGGDINLRYQLNPGSTGVKIASSGDTFTDVFGNQTTSFDNSDQAFKAGHDFFVNAKGDVTVNPAAPNVSQIAKSGESRPLGIKEEGSFRSTGQLQDKSKPLLGSEVTNQAKPGATIYNVQTGSVTDSAIPTAGDYGQLQLVKDGIQYGPDKALSRQNLNNEIGPQTNNLDASARYAWWAKRGIKVGDDISSTDIPGMETLYRGMQGGKLPTAITLDGELLSHEPGDILDMLREAKDDQVTQDIHDGKSMKEAGLRANVSQAYIQNNFNGTPDQFLLDPKMHTDLQHVHLWYDIGNLNMQDGNIIKGLQDSQYRVQLIKDQNQSAGAAYFGKDWESYVIKGNSSQAGIADAPGGGFLKSSQAGYKSFGQQFERVGRFISGKNSNDIQALNDNITSAATQLRSDPQAAAEVGNFVAVRHTSGEKWIFASPEQEQAIFPQRPADKLTGNVAILKGSSIADKDTGTLQWNGYYVPGGFVDGRQVTAGSVAPDAKGLRTYYELSPKAANWERVNRDINNDRLVHRNNWFSAQGIQKSFEPDTLYAPPIDTGANPFFALVKAKPGSGMADDSVAMITAKDAQSLGTKIAAISDKYSIFTKKGNVSTQMYHEIEGDYLFNRNFANNRVQNDLANRGILNDIFPITSAEKIIQRQYDWHTRQIVGLNRDYTELSNGQLFAELKDMGDQVQGINTSTTGWGAGRAGSEMMLDNPYQKYINTALNISPKENYKTWAYANEKVESLFGTAFDALKSGFQSAQKGLLPYEDASKLSQSFGLGNPYEAATNAMDAYYKIANSSENSRALSKFVRGSNSILSNGIIRLDAYQQLIHAITTPMLSAVEATSVKSQLKQSLITPIAAADGSGTIIPVPGTAKLIFNAVKNFWDDGIRGQYDDMYSKLGADKTQLGIHRNLIDELALPQGSFTPSALGDKIKRAADWAGKLSDFTNTFNHWVSADVGRQIFEAAGSTGQDLQDQVMSFVNRVQGNYIAGQRPVAFQGPLGQSIGLFQTFGLNMLQNLTRYVENGEGKTLGLLAGLQTGLFGMQGLPGFNFINQHLVGNAAGNPSHNDIYSGVASVLGGGKGSLGDYMMYGVTSNWLDANLFNRGDISPRQLTVLPINPMDWPSIKGGVNIVGNIINTASKIAQGGNVPASLLLGLEHNGLSRPLSGLAQIAQGYATDSAGNIIGSTQGVNGNSELISMANFSRLMGARPLDEAVALNSMYRKQAYDTKSEQRIQKLADAFKTNVYGEDGFDPSKMEDFMRNYTDAGGDINKFNSAMIRWTKQAKSAKANAIFDHLGTSGTAKNMMMEMGGQPLPDYMNYAQGGQGSGQEIMQ